MILNPVKWFVCCVIFVQFKVFFRHIDIIKQSIIPHMIIVPVCIDYRDRRSVISRTASSSLHMPNPVLFIDLLSLFKLANL